MTSIEFTKEYNDIQNLLYRFAIKLTKSEAAAKDLLQETAMKAFIKRETFNGTSRFKSWASTIMYNTFVNTYRSSKRRMRLAENLKAKQMMAPKNNMTGNAGYMSLLKEDLDKHVEAVGEKSKRALRMHIEGYQYKEISEHLNIPTGTVKSRINYARTKAKKSILDMGLYKQTA